MIILMNYPANKVTIILIYKKVLIFATFPAKKE